MYRKTGNFGGVKPDSNSFDERNGDEMLVKALIFVYAYFSWWLYFERLKFGHTIYGLAI